MSELDKVISEMDFNFFATTQHKMEVEKFFQIDDALFLDVRAQEELETLRLPLQHHCLVVEIPVDQVPNRLNEIPRDKTIGVFCSAGVRAAIIFTYLKSKGYEKVRILPGGYVPLVEAVKPGKLYKKLNK